MALVKSPVAATRSVWSEVKSHPVAMLLFGMVFAAFVFPMVAKWLGAQKAKGGTLASVIPQRFTA